MSDFVYWASCLSHHSAGAIRRLAHRWQSGEVRGVFSVEARPDRRILGWSAPEVSLASMDYLEHQPNPRKFVRSYIREHYDAIHFVAGFRGTPAVEIALAELRSTNTGKVIMFCEPLLELGWKRWFKRAYYRWHIRQMAPRLDAFLAMGSLSETVFTTLGIPPSKVYPYMYQVYPSRLRALPQVRETRLPVRFVYVGRFEYVKATDILLNAFRHVPQGAWMLDLIGGGGDLDGATRSRIATEAPLRKIQYLGARSSDDIIELLMNYDVCLLPSRHDGWGVVANEAIAAGIGAVVSDRAGCHDIISASGAGTIVAAGSTESLSGVLNRLVAHPNIADDWKMRARQYAPRIHPDVVGDYLYDIVQHVCDNGRGPRPPIPWLHPTHPCLGEEASMR